MCMCVCVCVCVCSNKAIVSAHVYALHYGRIYPCRIGSGHTTRSTTVCYLWRHCLSLRLLSFLSAVCYSLRKTPKRPLVFLFCNVKTRKQLNRMRSNQPLLVYYDCIMTGEWLISTFTTDKAQITLESSD